MSKLLKNKATSDSLLACCFDLDAIRTQCFNLVNRGGFAGALVGYCRPLVAGFAPMAPGQPVGLIQLIVPLPGPSHCGFKDPPFQA